MTARLSQRSLKHREPTADNGKNMPKKLAETLKRLVEIGWLVSTPQRQRCEIVERGWAGGMCGGWRWEARGSNFYHPHLPTSTPTCPFPPWRAGLDTSSPIWRNFWPFLLILFGMFLFIIGCGLPVSQAGRVMKRRGGEGREGDGKIWVAMAIVMASKT